MDDTSAQYQKDRNTAYDRILTVIQGHIDALNPGVTATVSLLSPSATQDAAARDIWSLFKNGTAHLKDGGQMGQPGLFGEAVSKASLRNAPLAKGLGVKPPKYEENYFSFEYEDGATEAVFFCRRLVEAAVADLPKSRQAIMQKLAAAPQLETPAEKNPVADPMLSGIFSAKQPAAESKPGADDLMAAIRKQSVMTFNLLSATYETIADTLKTEASDALNQPPPRPKPKGQSFDF